MNQIPIFDRNHGKYSECPLPPASECTPGFSHHNHDNKHENGWLNPWNAKFINLNFHPLEVVSHYRDPQHQVGEYYLYLFNLKPNICKSWWLNTRPIHNNSDLSPNKMD